MSTVSQESRGRTQGTTGDSASRMAPPDTPHVVALLPRGEAIRNFVFSGALDEVAAHAKVTVLSVVPDEEFQKLISGRYHGFHRLTDRPEAWIVGFTREMLDIAHGRALWSVAAQDRWRIRDAEAITGGARLKRGLKKLLCAPFSNQPGLELLSSWERKASWWFRNSDEFVRLFQSLKPTLVFNGSHVHGRAAVQAVNAAQWLGIPTAAFLFSWDNLTSQGRIVPPYDHYLVWNESIKRDLRNIYPAIQSDQIAVVGTPQFDFHFRPENHWSREEFCRRVSADPGRPVVLYSTGMANHMPGEPGVVEDIANMLGRMRQFGPPQLLVRVYPKDRTGRFEELKKRRPDILFPAIPWEAAWLTPKMDDLPLLTNMLRHCAAGINIASTVSLELCMFDKPVVNIGYDPPGVDLKEDSTARYYEFDHYKPVVSSGAVEVAYSAGEMERLLSKVLERPGERSGERSRLLEKMFGCTLDGRSSGRVAATLLHLAETARKEIAG